MVKKWCQDWRSWLTIILLLFIPTFLFGLILMWCCTPWSKRAKWWITGVGVGIPLAGILISLILVFLSPKRESSQAALTDSSRRTIVQTVASSAHKYCLDKDHCPASLAELKQNGYLDTVSFDSDIEAEYSYESLDSGEDCVVKTTLSDGQNFTRYCFGN